MKTIKWPILCLMITVVVIGSLAGNQSSSARGYYQTDNPTVIQAEGDDYATRILRDAWDMSEYSDISQYINQSGQASIVKNIQVNDGVFSATSVGNSGTGNNGYFFLLFPGYLTAFIPRKRWKLLSDRFFQISLYVCRHASLFISPGFIRARWFQFLVS